jgi:hypothetical protein
MNTEYFEKYKSELDLMNSLTAEAKRINAQSIELKKAALNILQHAKDQSKVVHHMRKVISHALDSGRDPVEISLSDEIQITNIEDDSSCATLWTNIYSLEEEFRKEQERVTRNSGYAVDPLNYP